MQHACGCTFSSFRRASGTVACISVISLSFIVKMIVARCCAAQTTRIYNSVGDARRR